MEGLLHDTTRIYTPLEHNIVEKCPLNYAFVALGGCSRGAPPIGIPYTILYTVLASVTRVEVQYLVR